MAKTLLGAAAQKAHLEIIDNPNDAELAIVLGDTLPADSSLNGKKSGWATLVVRLRTLNCSSAKRRAMQTLQCPGCNSTCGQQWSKTRGGSDGVSDRCCSYVYGC